MKSPVSVFNSLRETFFRYLDSPFDLRYSDLVQERRQLLNQDGRIYRDPLIEAVPAYRKCQETFDQVAHMALDAIWPRPLVSELADFVAHGFFPVGRNPYIHQR